MASDQNNAGRELAMRDAAFAQLGDTDLADGVPQGTSPQLPGDRASNTAPNPGQIARRVKGSFQVPCYLFPSCAPGGTFQLDAGGAPIQNGTWTANFDCIVPESVVTRPGRAGRPSLYGHGLFGSAGGGRRSSPQRSLSQEHGIVQCATDEIGMSQSDLPAVAAALQDLSAFPTIPDRLQQGLLNELFLGRAMISPTGFTTDPAFHQDGTLLSGRGARHQRALLQRQQPGRDHGRRPDRGRAGLHPRLARGAGDELLGAAAALGRLRPVRARSSTRPTRTRRRGR